MFRARCFASLINNGIQIFIEVIEWEPCEALHSFGMSVAVEWLQMEANLVTILVTVTLSYLQLLDSSEFFVLNWEGDKPVCRRAQATSSNEKKVCLSSALENITYDALFPWLPLVWKSRVDVPWHSILSWVQSLLGVIANWFLVCTFEEWSKLHAGYGCAYWVSTFEGYVILVPSIEQT